MKSLLEQLRTSIDDFNTSIDVVEPENSSSDVRFLSRENDSYKFNQLETLRRIDRYYLSQYESGKLDAEGQRKLFLNQVKFAADVAAKQTDVDVKDYIFIPDTDNDVDTTWFVKRLFTTWTRENGYGELLNKLNSDYSKYGTALIKKVGKELERVRLHDVMINQDAESIRGAIENGGYFIQKHNLTPNQMKKFRDWNVPERLEDKSYVVYEMRALVDPELVDEEGDEKVQAVAFILLEEKHILFKESETESPYEEAHWTKQDGRWLGIGEVENQFENQVARNLIEGLRHRNLLWASKKVFQSSDTDMVGKNLVKEVNDGEVLEVGPQGEISQVNLQTQHSVDFNQSDEVWSENARQKSFMFEVSTGEQMKAGTPFRLGVILSNAAQTHFNLKKENFAFFLEKSFFNQLMPIFKKDLRNKDHVLALASNEEGIERYQRAVLTVQANKRLKKKILDKNLIRNLDSLTFNFEEEFEKVREELKDKPYMFLKAKSGILDDVHFKMELSITGEEIDIPQQMETLVNLYQAIPPEDERRERVLNRIIALTGLDTGSILKKIQNKDNIQALNGNTTNGRAEEDISGIVTANARQSPERVR